MHFDNHEHWQREVDELLVTGESLEHNHVLAGHLDSCFLCREQHSQNTRIIQAWADLHLDVGPASSARVHAALKAWSAKPVSPIFDRRWAYICALAITLTALGSWLDIRISDYLAVVFDMQGPQGRADMTRFWIGPALVLTLLFPALPWLSAKREQYERKAE